LLCAIALVDSAPAYLLEPTLWPKGSKVVMRLGFGPAAINLQDGMASWNASAADALDIWNGYLDEISASSVLATTVPQVSGDGINSAFFSSTVFGDSFDEGTIAVTVILSQDGNSSATAEADVVVNTAFQFDSYRGPLQTGNVDFHRVVLHEFGHVLGLDHVTNNPPGQALMEPIISDLDHLGPDDTLGIGRVYGAMIYDIPGQVLIRVGDSFQFSVDHLQPTNSATSYTITGLPPGFSYDPASGLVGGTATTEGRYAAIVIAHGPYSDAYGTIPFYVQGFDRVQGLQGIIKVSGYHMVADPVRERIYAAGTDAVSMIDADSFVATELSGPVGDGTKFPNLSVSADGSMLLFTDSSQQPAVVNRVDLESSAVLSPLSIPANGSQVLEGLDNRDFVSGPPGVYQFDRTTGEMQSLFAPTGNTTFGAPPQIALSSDRTTLYVTEYTVENGPLLLAYDVSGPEPVLSVTVGGDFHDPNPSPDGKYLYYVLGGGGSGGSPVYQAELPGLNNTRALSAVSLDGGLAVEADGTLFTSSVLDSSFSLYDPASLQQTYNIKLNHFILDPTEYFAPFAGAFDVSGKYLFVSVAGYSAEVWAFSTDLGSFPVPVADPRQNLLNISTRARVEAGESAMVGGFIISGTDAKKVLIRGLGPSLPLTGALSDPVLDLYDSSGTLIATNDDWISDRLNILASAIPPTSEREAAILTTLMPGAYTAVVRDVTGQPGLGLVEIYDLDPDHSVVANISTRGKVETDDNVMIGGFIIGGAANTDILVRAIGPSLAAYGIQAPLADPVLELHDQYGDIVATNDNWRSTQQSDIIATGIPPTDDNESAIVATLYSGSYTAIVRGQNATIGVALVEVYNLDSNDAAVR
jgi:Matrixin/WD40-like Beta Propeller Repeat